MTERLSRRGLLGKLTNGMVVAAGAVLSVPILAYLLSPLLAPAPRRWLDIGAVSDFPLGETVLRAIPDPSPLPWAGQSAQTAVWVRRTAALQFIVFTVHCTHLGCPVNWVAGAQLFLCPCHGGVYYANGSVAAGPPTEPLPQYETRVIDGRLEALSRPLPVI